MSSVAPKVHNCSRPPWPVSDFIYACVGVCYEVCSQVCPIITSPGLTHLTLTSKLQTWTLLRRRGGFIEYNFSSAQLPQRDWTKINKTWGRKNSSLEMSLKPTEQIPLQHVIYNNQMRQLCRNTRLSSRFKPSCHCMCRQAWGCWGSESLRSLSIRWRLEASKSRGRGQEASGPPQDVAVSWSPFGRGRGGEERAEEGEEGILAGVDGTGKGGFGGWYWHWIKSVIEIKGSALHSLSISFSCARFL